MWSREAKEMLKSALSWTLRMSDAKRRSELRFAYEQGTIHERLLQWDGHSAANRALYDHVNGVCPGSQFVVDAVMRVGAASTSCIRRDADCSICAGCRRQC